MSKLKMVRGWQRLCVFVVATLTPLGWMAPVSARAAAVSIERACDYRIPEPNSSGPPSTSIDNPDTLWLTNDAAQVEIKAVWAELGPEGDRLLGAYVDFEKRNVVLVLNVGQKSAAITAVVEKHVAKLPLAVRQGCADKASLEALRNTIEIEASRQVNPTEAVSVGIDAAVGQLVVRTSKESTYWATFLAGPITKGVVRLDQTATIAPLARCGDANAHWGGAYYANTSGGCSNCSSGFKVKRNSDGKIGMASAGHCRDNIPAAAGNLYSGSNYFGEFFNWVYNGNGDWAFIGDGTGGVATYANKLYFDPGSVASLTVTGIQSSSVGDTLCVSGAVSKAYCSLIVQNTNSLDCSAGVCVYNVSAVRNSPTVVCQAGDSGGPAFATSSIPTNSALIKGIISYGVAAGSNSCNFNKVSIMMSAGYSVMTS